MARKRRRPGKQGKRSRKSGDSDPEKMRKVIEKLLREACKGDVDAQFDVALA